ncbi:Major sperm protein [Aphelenchoides besseyi]|nr:Major sperm protein [Aphelenchoides besseyi]KAI6209152.1 Major sperm protein [Aphelenchoides besseyi]
MIEIVGLFFGWILVVGSFVGLLVQCDSKSRKAKKRSVKSAKSAKKSAKRSAKKAKDSVKNAAELGKEKVKEKTESVKRSAKDANKSKKSSGRSSRGSSRGQSKVAEPLNALAEKAQSAKETVKQKVSQATQKAKQPAKAHPFDEVDANYQQKDLRIEPRELHFSKQGGFQKVQLHNPGTHRQAIKVKCSDNVLYRVSPVFGFIEPGNSLTFDVLRQNGEAKPDKLVFLVVETGDEAASAKAVFNSMTSKQTSAVVLPLKA